MAAVAGRAARVRAYCRTVPRLIQPGRPLMRVIAAYARLDAPRWPHPYHG